MESRGDSWESFGWDAAWQRPDEDADRDEVLQLARRLAETHQRQSMDALMQVEDLKRALRERAADVARRELEVERRTKELDELDAREQGRRLRLRRPEPQQAADHAYTEELLARREADLQKRLAQLAPRERKVIEREAALRGRELESEEAESALTQREQAFARRKQELTDVEAAVERRDAELGQRAASIEERERRLHDREQAASERQRGESEIDPRELIELEARERELEQRELELSGREEAATVQRRGLSDEGGEKLAQLEATLEAREAALVAREAEVLRIQAGLASQQEDIRRRERELDDAERLQERERAVPSVPYVSFSEGLDAFTGGRRLG